MKISQEHYNYLADKLNITLEQYQAYRGLVEKTGKFKCLNTRVRWDLAYRLVGSKWICDNLYSYMNDDHLDAALRKIFKPFEKVTS